MHRITRTTGRASLPLVLAVVAAAMVLAATVGRSDAQTQGHMRMGRSGSITRSQLALRNQMRALWEQHVAWTRLAIVSFDGGLPDLPATEHRLLRNQVDIGNAVIPFYGTAAGHTLTRLLRSHILIAVDVLADAKAGDQAALTSDLHRWYRNANRIAAFLHAANPNAWSLAAMRRMMHTHLRLTTTEAVDELNRNFTASVRDYNRVEQEILRMADMLSTGIIQQFPGRFS